MDSMLEKLKEYGADVDGSMERFLGDIDLYKTCFAIFLEDKAFFKLGEALLARDYKLAFDCAHTLKGVTGNMGLTPFYQVSCNMVEKLREGDYSELQEYYQEAVNQMHLLSKLQQEIQTAID